MKMFHYFPGKMINMVMRFLFREESQPILRTVPEKLLLFVLLLFVFLSSIGQTIVLEKNTLLKTTDDFILCSPNSVADILLDSADSKTVLLAAGLFSDDVERVTGQKPAIKYNARSVSGNCVIAGSDRRGTAFGLLELSRQMGVSPWYYFADVPPVKREEIIIKKGTLIQKSPSVQYRGIFINDEMWGIRPWDQHTLPFNLPGFKTVDEILSGSPGIGLL